MFKFKELVFLIVPAILVIIILIIAPTILHGTGTATGTTSSIYQSAKVNWEVNSSTTAIALNSANITTDTITSLSITGNIEGPGGVKIFLVDEDNNRFLVYSNTRQNKPAAITGFSVAVGSENFQNECIETCYLPVAKDPNKLRLSFELEQGTVLKISRLVYR